MYCYSKLKLISTVTSTMVEIYFGSSFRTANPTQSDFKYPTDFGFWKMCRIPSYSDSESVISLSEMFKFVSVSVVLESLLHFISLPLLVFAASENMH